ncbi:monovalent cation/H(+) antiporter subunit G [Candidatus Latescibacterota bacterium]
MIENIGFVLLFIGVLFDLFGCIGLVRLPDVYNRLQAATKCVTLGTCMILIGLVFIMGIGSAGIKALLCAAFILLTSPVAAHALARAAHKVGVKLCDSSVVDEYAKVNSK